MNVKELKTIAQLGEDSGRQFKVDVRNADSLASEMVAFSNSGGGQAAISAGTSGFVSTSATMLYNGGYDLDDALRSGVWGAVGAYAGQSLVGSKGFKGYLDDINHQWIAEGISGGVRSAAGAGIQAWVEGNHIGDAIQVNMVS